MRVTTVNISFPKVLLKAIDQVAEEEARSRSDLLREATRVYIERKRRLRRMFAFWKAEAKRKRFGPKGVDKTIQDYRRSKHR